jgi:adenosylcobinamide kinase/adenosylcobinamide-phosphate guanylyltransferase
MILIIGGAYQGKLTYALKTYGILENDVIDLANEDPSSDSRVFTHFEAYTKQAAYASVPFEDFIDDFMRIADGSIVISREIGCGIVPVDEKERYWREYHGRALKALADRAEEFIRVFCGIAEKMK